MNKVRILFFFIAAFFIFPLCLRADDLERFESGGRQRSYHIHVPETGPGPFPLVLVFHGAVENAFAVEKQTGFSRKAGDENFIVVYPNGTSEYEGSDSELTWNGGNCCGYADVEKVDDVAFVRDLVARIRAQYPVDPDRIYAAGFSNGALLSYRLACEASDLFAAIAPVSGALLPECRPDHPVAVMAFNGTADMKVLYKGGYSPVITGSKYDMPVSFAMNFWAEHNGCSPEPAAEKMGSWVVRRYSGCSEGSALELYTIPGGDHVWPEQEGGISATDLIWDFFKKHPRQPSKALSS